MDLQAGLVSVGVVVVSAAVILLVLMFGIKGKSYDEAIAEQRKLPDDFLLSKKDKGKEKKHKNKSGKKVKEKKEEKDEKEDKEEKPEHVQFEENPQVLPLEPLLRKENLQQLNPSEPVANKSPKETPTKSKKNVKESIKKKDENVKEEKKEEKKDIAANANVHVSATKESTKDSKETKEGKEGKEIKEGKEAREVREVKEGKEVKDGKDAKENKEVKDPQKETPVKDVKEVVKETVSTAQLSTKESKKTKKKNDILAQIGGDKDAVNVSLLMLFIQKAELSRSEVQILIDQLLNKQMDNPSEHSEWTEGRADPVIKLKKQLAEKEKALADEREASIAFQNKLKELRAELNAERSRFSASARQYEETVNAKVTEAQTLHTRMQHILESHAAEKQGFARQIEQLQTKVNEDATIIHKMQEDQGQAQGHLQQELISQRKQMEVQFAQMRDNENALKTQLTQKHVEVQELQSELQATCESSTAEIEMLRQQLVLMQGQLMHTEGQLQHFKEAGDRLQDVARQLDESHRANADLDHRLKTAHRHEQELQKQVNTLQAELNVVKTDANETSALKNELTKTQNEMTKLKSELSTSVNEAKSEAAEITSLKAILVSKEEELHKSQDELNAIRAELKQLTLNTTQLEAQLKSVQKEREMINDELATVSENWKKAQDEASTYKNELKKLQEELSLARTELANAQAQIKAANEAASELSVLKTEMNRLQDRDKKSNEAQLQFTRLQEENDRLTQQVASIVELQKELKQLQEENESLASQLAATTERPAVEGRENGIEDKVQKNNMELVEQANLLAQKESQLSALRTELMHKETELSQLNAQVDVLRSDVNNQHSLAKRLQDDLETQRSKNNEITQKIKQEQEELTKAFLQRIFPEIKINAKSHDQWLSTFEDKAYTALNELRKNNTSDTSPDLERQNKNLQDMVSHYKQIIDDTEGMLNKLQSYVESEETRWEIQLRQKENEVAKLKAELNDVLQKLTTNETLQEKVVQLEARLVDAEKSREQASAEVLALRSSSKPISKQEVQPEFVALEKLQEEKARLSEELQTESNKRATLDAEVIKLRSLVETSESSLAQEKNLVSQLQQEVSQLKNEICGGCSSSEQSMLNGPPASESPKSEGGSGKK